MSLICRYLAYLGIILIHSNLLRKYYIVTDAENMNETENVSVKVPNKRPWLILGLFLTIVFITILAFISDSWRDHRSISDVKIYGSKMASSDSIAQSVYDSVKGKYIKDINLAQIDSIVRTNTFVSEVRLNPLFNGEFQIFINERTPLALTVDISGNLSFADARGYTFPFVQDSTLQSYPIIRGMKGTESFRNTAVLLNRIKSEAPEYYDIISEIMPGRGYNTYEIISSDYGYRIIIDSESSLSEQLNKYFVFLGSSICANDKINIDYLDLRWEKRLVIGKLA